MKNSLLFLCLIAMVFGNAQYVGINTVEPKATFDVVGTPDDVTKADGIIPPRITLAQLNAKTSYGAAQKGILIYITDLTGGSTRPSTEQITTIGHYQFTGTTWESIVPKSVIFTATLNGTATIAQTNFNTVPLPSVTINQGGGFWDSGNNTYSIPISGTYLIKSTVRLQDGFGIRNIFQAVHTVNADISDGIWQRNPGAQRWTMLYTRIAYFNKGDLLRLYIYSDGGPANLMAASLNIALLNQN